MTSSDTMKPALASLARTCEAIANGRFDEVEELYQVITDNGVEADIRALAETFSGMVVQVEAREFHSSQLISELTETKRQLEAAEAKLRKENAELKTRLDKFEVTYDQEQAKAEVEQVSESDYFRSLQSRAKDLRSRYKS
ncbi:hypothetical protein [Roseibium sp. LAB1]